jgi:3-methyladenine DNA glycosylase AlkD
LAVAVISLRPYESNRETIEQVVEHVDQWEVVGLAGRWFGALYLDQTLADIWVPDMQQPDREFRQLARGIVAFDRGADEPWY